MYFRLETIKQLKLAVNEPTGYFLILCKRIPVKYRVKTIA